MILKFYYNNICVVELNSSCIYTAIGINEIPSNGYRYYGFYRDYVIWATYSWSSPADYYKHCF